MDIDFRDELPQWHEALAEFGHSTGLHVVDWLKFNKLTPLELIAACAPCGVVASMFSTVLAEAACLRAKTISILYPEIGQWAFSRAAPYLPTQAYEVALGCARIARSPQELEAAVYSALRASRVESLATRARQAHFFNNKGGNAEITASIICELAALT
jgi:hypothetical protein